MGLAGPGDGSVDGGVDIGARRSAPRAQVGPARGMMGKKRIAVAGVLAAAAVAGEAVGRATSDLRGKEDGRRAIGGGHRDGRRRRTR